jgi:hypothetical protein
MNRLPRQFTLAVCAACVVLASCAGTSRVIDRTFTAADLYGGLEASRVLQKDDRLVLDTRNWTAESRGIIVTDVIDLSGEGVLAEEAVARDLRVAVNAETPAGSAVNVEIRTGGTYFQEPKTWDDWRVASGAVDPKGRYAQVRLILTTPDPQSVPTVRSLTLSRRLQAVARKQKVVVVSENVQKIVRSPVSFSYERPTQPDLVWLRKAFRLDDVIAGEKTEFGKLRALMHWVATRPNKRPGPWEAKNEPYPWHVRRVMTGDAPGAIYGHCMSYCEVMITAASALGWHGRHWAIHGVRDTSHEVPEFWIDELGKWVFFDPSLDTYYADPETREPLNLLEMHELYLKTVLRPGEVQKMGRTHNEDRLKLLRGRHPVLCITGDYAYGKPTKWDWQWDHGYMSAGWMQLTPRNDWHSRPEPAFRWFGQGPEGYDGFPLYLDAQTPLPSKDASRWYTRKRDLWWTLNQASFRLVRTGEKTILVECGNSQPFFRRYLARIGDTVWKPVDARFTWDLVPGDNRIEVVPEDDSGRRGIVSSTVARLER